MTAIDAYHVKQAVFETLHTELFHLYANTFTASMRGEAGNRALPQPDFIETGDALLKREVRIAKASETFYVSPLMQKMVTAAAESWPLDEDLTEEDWPVPHGFMYVPGGVTTIDVRGMVQTTVAFSWEIRGSETHVTWWTDKQYDSPYQREAFPDWEGMPRYLPWHITVLKNGKPLPIALNMGTVLPPEVAMQIKYNETPEGYSIYIPEGWTAEQLQPTTGPDRVSAWLVSALRIMQQPLVSVERKGVPANVRRAAMKRPFRLKQKAVTVIDFRQRKGDFVHSGEREFSHRFLRRGHWRRQPYKREDGTWDRRRIWIHPQIVGDPSKPLILREHVNALTR